MTPEELKALREQIQGAFDQLKQAGDNHHTELKKYGEVTEETKATVARINQELDQLKSRLDLAETKMNRAGYAGAGGQEEDQEAKARKAAFYKYFKGGREGLTADERKALVQDEVGQIIVPEEIDQEIYRELPKLTLIRQLATVRGINSDRIKRVSMNEVTVGWGKLEVEYKKGESTSLEDYESELVPFPEWQYVENAYGLTKVGEDELMDTNVKLEQYIAASFVQAFAEAEDTAFINGRGHAFNEPEGILLGNYIPRFNSGAAGAVHADDLIKLAYQVPAQYRMNAVYIVNSMTELGVRLSKDLEGRYLWQPSLVAGTPATFNGRPIHTQDDIPEIAAGKDVAIFGDIKAGYRVLDRMGSSIKRLDEKYIENDLIGFRFKRRVGGGPVRANAMRILRVAQ